MKIAIYIVLGLFALFVLCWLLACAARDAEDTSEHSNMDLDQPDDDAAATVMQSREDDK